jgi:predicted amidohydrolase
MAERVTVACVQLSAGREVGSNLEIVSDLVRQAAAAGAKLITTPENAVMIEPRRAPKFAQAEDEAQPYALASFQSLARETGAWLLAGSIATKLPDEPERLANRSTLLSPDGRIVAQYDKIHMFDVDLANGESYRESSQFRPGDKAVVANTPWGGFGLSVCYDLRFPALYRALAQAGARLIGIPSAFTVPTGRAHWHVLVRARAIETGCFVLAPAQTGTHAEGRKTYGHSLIVDPWGEILAEAGEEVGFITADLDLGKIDEARRMVPSLGHDRSWRLLVQ